MPFKTIIDVLSFDKKTVSQLAKRSSFTEGYLVVAVVALILSLVMVLFPQAFDMSSELLSAPLLVVFFSAIISATILFLLVVAWYWVSSFVYHLVARLFGGGGSVSSLVRVFCFTSPLLLLSMVPNAPWVYALLVSLWKFSLDVFVIRVVEGLSWLRALGVFAVLVVALLFLFFVLALLLGLLLTVVGFSL